MKRLLVLAAGILVLAPGARAATITVDITGDVVATDMHCSLREGEQYGRGFEKPLEPVVTGW